jgi:hypothetical protein
MHPLHGRARGRHLKAPSSDSLPDDLTTIARLRLTRFDQRTLLSVAFTGFTVVATLRTGASPHIEISRRERQSCVTRKSRSVRRAAEAFADFGVANTPATEQLLRQAIATEMRVP